MFRNVMRPILRVSLYGLIVGLLIGCNSPQGNPNQSPAPSGSSSSAPSASTAPTTNSNVFNPAQVKPGDSVAGLTIVAIEATPYQDRGYVGTAKFRGETTVSGTYKLAPDAADAGTGNPCFFADAASASKLPRFANDERVPWFCFTNAAAVEQALGQPTATGKQVTIAIADYETVYQPSDVVNQAKFVRVVEPSN